MIILNFLIFGFQKTSTNEADILATVVPFVFMGCIFGLATYFIAKARGKKSFWYFLSGFIPLLSIVLIIVLLATPSKAEKEKEDRLNELEKEVAKLRDEKNKTE